jgi:hypothetical protein
VLYLWLQKELFLNLVTSNNITSYLTATVDQESKCSLAMSPDLQSLARL